MNITSLLRSLLKKNPKLHRAAILTKDSIRYKWYRQRGLGYVRKEIIDGPNKGLLFYASKKVWYSKEFWSGNFELDTCRFMETVIDRDNICYDIGANLGYYSLIMARKASRGLVFAFEPLPEARLVFKDNITSNGIDNIILIEKAVAGTNGLINLGWDVSIDQASARWTGQSLMHTPFSCEATTVDDFVEAGNPVPNFIKIDVEGAESEVLSGAIKTLTNSHVLVLCEIHGLDAATKVYEILKQIDYQLFKTGKTLTRINSVNDMPTNMYQGHVFTCPQ